MKPVTSIEAVPDFTVLSEVVSAQRPVVLRQCLASWPAVTEAKRSRTAISNYIKRFDIGKPARVFVGEPDILGKFFYDETLCGVNFNGGFGLISQALDRLALEIDAQTPYAISVQSADIGTHLPGFLQDNPMPLLANVPPRVWINNAMVTAAHYDLSENLACVVAGRRTFTFFAPDQLANLYPGPFDKTLGGPPVSMVDIENPDLTKHPDFAKAMREGYRVTLEAGDAVFIPYGWWHHVRSHEPLNVLVNYWWNAAPLPPADPYHALYHAILALRDMPGNQRDIWRGLFDYYVFNADHSGLKHLTAQAAGSLGPLTPELVARLKKAVKASLTD